MLRVVHIIEKDTKLLIASYPIVLQGITPINAIFYDEAWKNAIDEELVAVEKRSRYEICFARPIFDDNFFWLLLYSCQYG